MDSSTSAALVIDIGANNGGPAEELSNFPEREFIVRGIHMKSMEGLIQGAKFKDIAKQNAVFNLFGKAAKFKGKKSKWFNEQILYWQGEPFSRHSSQWQELLDEAFEALYTQNATARAALLATGDAVLTHSIGKDDPHRTALTTEEFTSRLMRIRAQLRHQQSLSGITSGEPKESDMTAKPKSRLAQDIDFEIRRVFGELAVTVRQIKRLAAETVTDQESAERVLAMIDGHLTLERAGELSELAGKGDFGAIEAERKKILFEMLRHEIAGTLTQNAKKLGVICDELEQEHL